MQKLPISTVRALDQSQSSQLLQNPYSDGINPPHTSKPFARRKLIASGWILELLSLLLASAALAAIITTLFLHQNKPLPKWPSMITVNTLLAVFTAILKTALLFPVAEGLGELKWLWFGKRRPLNDIEVLDVATRGPWGSLQLLFRRRYPLFYKLGAAIIVAALAIDPFTQQILRYGYCSAELQGESASVNRTNDYFMSGPHQYAGSAILDSGMTVAMYRGTLDPISSPTEGIFYNCPTGNCTFDDSAGFVHRSIGICSHVEDITDSVEKPPTNATTYYQLKKTGLRVGAGTLLDVAIIDNVIDGTYGPPLTAFEVLMLTYQCNSTATRDKEIQALKNSGAGPDCPVKPLALRAWLRPCVKTFSKVTINNFQLFEVLHSTMDLPSVLVGPGFAFSFAGDLPSLPGIDCSPSTSPTTTKNTNTSQIIGSGGIRVVNDLYSPLFYQNETEQPLYFDPACTYTFAAKTMESISDYAYTFWNGSVVSGYGLPANGAGDPWLMKMYQTNGSYSTGFADLESVTVYMQGVADTMSSTIRQQAPVNNSALLFGNVLVSQTCIYVNWVWLGLPGGLLVLAVIFLCYSMTVFRAGVGSDVRSLWKTSMLPVLWSGLEERIRLRHEGMDSIVAMERISESLQVSLTSADTSSHAQGIGVDLRRRGWRLDESEEPPVPFEYK